MKKNISKRLMFVNIWNP